MNFIFTHTKPVLLGSLLICFISSHAQTSGNIQLTNNAVSPAPAFSLGAPAILSSTTFRKGNFYFNPEFNIGLDLKPWTIISRIGYYVMENKKSTISLSANTNWYFMKNKPLVNDQEYQIQQYYALEFNGEFRPKENHHFTYLYWRSGKMTRKGVLFENFVNFAYEFSKIKLGSKNVFMLKPCIFYLEDKGWLSGFFTSQTASYKRENWKCNVSLLTCLPLSNMPGTKFIWSAGLNYPF